MNIIKQKERVFWHESGHFFAAYYNKLFFGKLGSESFSIRKTEYNGGIDFLGFHAPLPPPDYKVGDPIIHPASLCASLVYGCIFQCLYQNTSLNSCFDDERYMTNGFDDFNRFWGVANHFGLNTTEKKELNEYIQEYFNSLRSDLDFMKLFNTKVVDFIDTNDEEIFINLNELENRIKPFLDSHLETYKKFVNKLENVFQGHHYTAFPFRN